MPRHTPHTPAKKQLKLQNDNQRTQTTEKTPNIYRSFFPLKIEKKEERRKKKTDGAQNKNPLSPSW